MTWPTSSGTSQSTVPTWWGFPWGRSPHFTSACAIANGRDPWWSPGAATDPPARGQSQFRADAERLAAEVETEGMEKVAKAYAQNASRVQFQNKDPRGWAEWRDQFAGHSAAGTSMTLRNVQAKRPSLLDLQTELASLQLPVLLVAGDEDDHALDITLWLKRTLPGAGLCLFPKTGHTVNLEEPARFNDLLQEFLWRVEGNAWSVRDPRSFAASSMFPED